LAKANAAVSPAIPAPATMTWRACVKDGKLRLGEHQAAVGTGRAHSGGRAACGSSVGSNLYSVEQ